MTFEIKFTPEAEETYDVLLRQRWGDRFVIKLEAKILETLNAISSTPYLYPII